MPAAQAELWDGDVAPEPVYSEAEAERGRFALVEDVPTADAGEDGTDNANETITDDAAGDDAMEDTVHGGPPMHVGGGASGLVQDTQEPPRAVFADLGLSEPILQAIAEMGYLNPTPIQEQAIPVVLMGRDVLGVAQTGTGKTASFTLPLMDILAGSRARARMPRSLILEPTRELALQVAENFVQYGKHLKLNHALLIAARA